MKAEASHVYYGCLLCLPGWENKIIHDILIKFDMKIISPTKLRYHRKKGQYSIKTSRIFPGYLFFSTNQHDIKEEMLENIEGVICLLKYSNDDWALLDNDAGIVIELFKNNGVIGISKGSMIDGRLRIREGFLKDHENEINKVDKRHRTARVRMMINDQPLEDWFGYDIDGDERVVTYETYQSLS